MSDFFNNKKEEKPVADTQPVTEAFKIGEKEYSQEDLTSLVGLGERAKELESKWDTKIDSLMPSYTKATQELKSERELRQEAERRATEYESKMAPTNNLSREEMVKQARQEAKSLGLLTVEDFDSYYEQRKAGEQLHKDTIDVISEAKDKGQPEVDEVKLLQYMADNGLRNPKIAYKTMFESEIDAWKEKQLKELKPSSINTTSVSTAGGKQPEEVIVTSSNLKDLLKEAFTRE